MAYIEIQNDQGQWRVEIDSDRLTIGRHPSNQICLEHDVRVSRYHCELRVDDQEGTVVLHDLESRNGTHVTCDGKESRVDQAQIPPGGRFRVGKTHMRLMPAGEGEEASSETEAEIKQRRRQGRFRGGRSGRALPGQGVAQAHDEAPDATEAGAAESVAAGLDEAPTREEGPPAAPGAEPGAEPGGRADFSGDSVEALAHVGEDVPYGEHQIALFNARGELVHPAGEASEQQKKETAEIVRIVRLTLLACIRAHASDVHVEPREDGGAVRLRVDGTMVQACTIDEGQARRLLSLIKILSDLDITNRTGVQEGHFAAEAPDRRIDYRVSFTPSMHGQKLVLRVLDPVSSPQTLDDLQLPVAPLRRLRRLAGQDAGLMLAAGPTGSGKTTTLYAMLREVDAQRRNVITIEDPIEYALPGATQIPVDESQGHSFRSLLKSVLRQDPDVILVGEVRDKETATIAMRAATTGHMVLSSIHAQDSVGTIFRLLDLGVEPYLIGSTLNIVIAQRLVRTLCEQCKRRTKPTTEQRAELLEAGEQIETLWRPVGCGRCFGTGFVGRRAVCEMLHNTDTVRDTILGSPTARELREALAETEFKPLRQTGLDLVRQGVTSLDEIDRIIGQ